MPHSAMLSLAYFMKAVLSMKLFFDHREEEW
jgi:hypothetical protein